MKTDDAALIAEFSLGGQQVELFFLALASPHGEEFYPSEVKHRIRGSGSL